MNHPYRYVELIPLKYVYDGWLKPLLVPYLAGMVLAYLLVIGGNLLGVVPLRTIYGMHNLIVGQMVVAILFGPIIHWTLLRVYPNQHSGLGS